MTVRPIRALAALGLAAITASAVPLVRVWTARQESPSAPLSAGDGKFLLDLVDGATDADVQAIESKYSVVLTPNSQVTVKSNRLYHVSPKPGALLDLDALQRDSRVEAAEPEIQVSLSPDELGIRRNDPFTAITPFVITSDGPLKGRHVIYFSGRSGGATQQKSPDILPADGQSEAEDQGTTIIVTKSDVNRRQNRCDL